MRRYTRTKTKDGVLVDLIRKTPVDRHQLRFRRRVLLLLLLVVALLVGWVSWRFLSDRPVDYSDIREQFKYGSIGSEPGGSLLNSVGGVVPPYWIFKVLPEVCPDRLPGGYASVGFVFEEGMDRPIGVSKRRRLGVDQAGLNCAVCHTGTVRESVTSERQIVLGMPSHQLDLHAFTRFLVECSVDERFTADNVLGKMADAGADLSLLDRFLYRYQVIPRVRDFTLVLGRRIARLLGDEVTAWGRGRVDTFNPYKSLQFNWRLDQLPRPELIGAADFPSLWNQEPRDKMQLHWDGNNDSVDERNLSASLGAGVTPVTVDHPRLERIRDWIWTLPPPEYPWPIDMDKATAGEAIYAARCLDCHADVRFRDKIVEGTRVGTVMPIDEIATDPHRLDSYTYLFAVNQYTLYPDSPYSFKHFRKTNGYANQPLDGIWARAPYLHNGSVPTLRDLLEAPEQRPRTFYRGYDVYDQERVGFVSDVGEEDGVHFTFFDTTLPGNGNGGHVYGIDLQPEEKDALVEYLKRF